ncbi:MAG: hypothetical protein IKQ84_00750, partial [Spirochaetaceae bacterium]|nr:hypothetical protein [Spirochaetaceae bacterium]
QADLLSKIMLCGRPHWGRFRRSKKMKRIIIVFIIVFSIISNLSAQDSKTINGTILEKKNINNHTLVSKKHEQDLTLDY